MREYDVHFAFYDEQYGAFDNVTYPIQSANPFEAREQAWRSLDEDEATKYRSCIKQYAVT